MISVKIAHAYAQQCMTDQWGGTMRVREEWHLAYLRTSGQLLIPLRLDKNAATVEEIARATATCLQCLVEDNSPWPTEQWRKPLAKGIEEKKKKHKERAESYRQQIAIDAEEKVAAEFDKMIELWQIVSKYSTEIRALAKGKRIFFAPEIPQKRLNGALQSYGAIESGERPLVLIDESLFGGAKIGILLTDQQIYAHEMWKPPLS